MDLNFIYLSWSIPCESRSNLEILTKWRPLVSDSGTSKSVLSDDPCIVSCSHISSCNTPERTSWAAEDVGYVGVVVMGVAIWKIEYTFANIK
jgi:hypothetical protein